MIETTEGTRGTIAPRDYPPQNHRLDRDEHKERMTTNMNSQPDELQDKEPSSQSQRKKNIPNSRHEREQTQATCEQDSGTVAPSESPASGRAEFTNIVPLLVCMLASAFSSSSCCCYLFSSFFASRTPEYRQLDNEQQRLSRHPHPLSSSLR